MRAYDRCWFIGDDFGSRSFEQHFQACKSVDYNGYVCAHFDTTGYFGNFVTGSPSMLARYSNVLVQAMYCNYGNKVLPLPKIIVVVPDDDLLKLLHSGSDDEVPHGICTGLSKILNYIMTEFERNIAAFKEYLPAKSLKSTYPQILWIKAPLHDNFTNNHTRQKFNRALEEITKLHANSSTLMLKRVWDSRNLNLYLKDCQRFTSEGYTTYWEAVDRTVCYFDSVLLKKQLEKGKNPKKFSTGHVDKDRFKWQNPQFNMDNSNNRGFKLLPPPP